MPYYRKKMEEKGLSPADVQSSDDLYKLPFLTKADLRGATLAGVEVRALKMKETSIDLPIAVAIAEGMGAKLF